ncbi:MAG TPA: hypothetical protein EYP43_00940, partial [Thermoplasmata archaeon]|nr:hypothetical protein [Thermoplasmata archaeon]
EAIDSAANGSVIRVYDGLYAEYLRIEKTVEIVGNGTDRTVIDGRGVRIVVRISYDGVNITHLEVTGSEDHRDGFWDAGILVEAANVTIADVLLRDNDEGLLAFESPGLALLDCTFDRNSLPVRISEADGARLLNNTFLRNGEGMDIWHSVGCTLRDNVFDAYGVRLFGGRPECYGSHDIDRSNTVDGRPVVYISGSTGTDIPPDAAQVIVTNRSGVRVGNLTMTNVTHGVQVAFADDTLLSGLTVTNCSKEALRAVWSDRLILDGVNCTGSEDGVQILYCNSTVITDCNMSSNEWYGLDLAYSENVTVLRTVVARNGNGMHLQNMSDSVIRGNDILRNQGDGIQVMSTDDTMILRNRIEHNRGWGLNINPSSEGNFVHMNDFEWNGGLQAQAFDKDGGADWSNGTVGNYWSDYTGSDDDRDGIGDTPYHLDTDTDVVDPHPVMERFRPSALDDPPRAVILSVTPFPATCGGNVTFVAFASDSDGEVTLYVWSSSIDGEFYNGTANSTTTNRLSEGVHTIVLRCMDDEGAWSAPATLVLEVREPSNATNERPHASILLIAPDPARAGENMTFEATGGDDDGVVVRIRWNSSRDGLLYDGPAWSFERNLSSGLHNISLVVQDDDGGWSLPEWLYVAVHPDQSPSNRWPVALIDSIEPDPAVAGRNVTLVGNGTDEDGNVTRYIWISDRDGLLYSSPKGTWTTSMLSPGVHTIQLRVIDDEGAWSNATTVVLTVRPPANVRPEAVIVEINPSPAYNDSAVHFVGGGDDPDGTIVWYFWESNLAEILYDGPNSSFTSDSLP